MPAYSYECEKHGMFEVTCRLADWSDKKNCPKCKKPSDQRVLPGGRDSFLPEAIVVHVAADGTPRFPAHKNARVPKGFEKRELRTIREVESFERQTNNRLKAEAQLHQENEERFYEGVRRQNRSDLQERMKSMSPIGRAFAELAIKRNNERGRKTTDCGFYTEILHYDASNRAAHRDRETNWQERHS